MSLPTPLSAASRRTDRSPISELMQRALAAPDLISLAAGFVDHATLPVEPTARAAAAMLADDIDGRRSLQYGTTRGDLKLRQQLIAHIEADEKVAPGTFADAQHRLVVTTGSQQLLELVCEALLDPGDIVLVESPTYFVFLPLVKTRGAQSIGIETDAGGMRLDSLEEALAEIESRGQLDKVKLVYTITEHSNPSGLCLAADRRAGLVALVNKWSKRQQIFILEDSAYRGLTYDGIEPPSVWRHDPEARCVILARTFSKTYSPGLKVGYGVLPEALIGPVLDLKGNHDFGSAHFNQQLLAEVMASGDYRAQIALMRSTYKRKRDVMLNALEEHLAPVEPDATWTRAEGGIYVWLTLPEGIDTGPDGPLFPRCVKHGVIYVPGAYAFAGSNPPTNHARLTFGVTSESGIVEGIRRLSVALAECLVAVD